ncbi:unnamed protein product [Closterium sp. NIES-53]
MTVPLDLLGPHQDLGSMIEGAVNYIQVMQMRLSELQQRVLEGEIRARLNRRLKSDTVTGLQACTVFWCEGSWGAAAAAAAQALKLGSGTGTMLTLP